MDWSFRQAGPDEADANFMRALRETWGWMEPVVWTTVRQSAGNLVGARKWWSEYTHEVRGRQLSSDRQGEPLTLTLFDPSRVVAVVVLALRVRVFHDPSGVFLERITYPDGALTLDLRGLVDYTRPTDINAAWRGRDILTWAGRLGSGRRRGTGWIDAERLLGGLRRTVERLLDRGTAFTTDDVAAGFYDDDQILASRPMHRKNAPEDPGRELRRLCNVHLSAEFQAVVSRLVEQVKAGR